MRPTTTDPTTTEFVLVRHGETAWNAEGRIQGQHDVPLNDIGRAQAQAVAAALAGERFDAVLASDLARVRETAAPAAARLGLAPALDARLRERHYGGFQTLTYAEAKTRFPAAYARFRDKDPSFDFGGGESLAAFNARVLDTFADIVRVHAGRRLLVFTHGGVLEMLYRAATGCGLSSARDFEIPNCGINRLAWTGAGWRVEAWARTAHLPGALDDLPG